MLINLRVKFFNLRMLQYAKSKGIQLKLFVNKKRLDELCEKARDKIPIPKTRPLPVIEDYYEPSEVGIEDLMMVLPNFLNEEYQQLSKEKLEEITEKAEFDRKEQMKQFQTSQFIQTNQRIRSLKRKKDELIENNFLLKVEIDSQQHRIDIAQGKMQYFKHCRQLIMKQQISSVERTIDKELLKSAKQLEEISQNYDQQLRIIKNQTNIETNDVPSPNLSKYASQANEIQKEYEQIQIKTVNTMQKSINQERMFIEQLTTELMQQFASQSTELNATIKNLMSLPQAPTADEMKELFKVIEKDKKYINRKKQNTESDRREIQSTKRRLKSNIKKFEEMIQRREKLKNTLKIS